MDLFKLGQVAIAYSQSLLAYQLNGGPRPFSASFAVSNRCNIHCHYCNFPNMDLNDLSLDKIDLLFKRLKRMGVRRLGLLGGEPLLRRDIHDIISLATKAEFLVSLNSNLLLYDKHKNKLDAIDYFFTSLDGTPEKHISNRGKQDFDRIIEAIKDIVQRGKKISAICVVTENDYDSVDYLIELAKKEKFTVHFQPECFDTEIVMRSAPIDLENKSTSDFWNYLYQRKLEGAPIASSKAYLKYISGWKDFKVSSVYSPNDRCAAGRGYLFVDAQGVAYPCAFTKGKVKGVNLLEEEWEESFNPNTPCTKCIVGPMLEFNMLFKKPIQTIVNALGNV
jgi:MoaA/NifB/PqqE/SkfB family radical SAM enzyme